MEPLVSIIIPTYNRKDLIGETLNSISQQTYINWECLIVDDVSTDDSEKLIMCYLKKDKRFQYYKRPEHQPKGANTCRNIGLEQCQGDYVIFFDSDDLMTPNHIELKLRTLLENECDYVITKTKFFNYEKGNVLLEENYNFSSKDISAYSYISQKINWLTLDVCIKTHIARTIMFNEVLRAGQEYNYFSKLTIKTTNAIFINEIVSLRRFHDKSIRSNLIDDKIASYQSYMHTYWYTYLETKTDVSKRIRHFLIYKCFRLSLKLPRHERLYVSQLNKALIKELGSKGVYYILKLKLSKGL